MNTFIPPNKKDAPRIIPVFIPHAGCPHQCVFCNQRQITGETDARDLSQKLEQAAACYMPDAVTDNRPVVLAFYGGNFLGLSPETIDNWLSQGVRLLQKWPDTGIRFSTRPETITPERLSQIASYPVKTIELGVQSMHDVVLHQAGRGHTVQDTVDAVALLKKKDVETGLQLMLGLPGETREMALSSARRLAGLAPDFVRIYPTLVLAGSALAGRFEKGCYHPLDLPAAVEQAAEQLRIFHHNHIPVIRMGLQATASLEKKILAGPYHSAFGHLVYAALFRQRLEALLKKGDFADRIASVAVHPRSEARLRGMKNENLRSLERVFGLQKLKITRDVDLPKDQLQVGDGPPVSIWDEMG